MKNRNPLTTKMMRLTIFVFLLIAGTLLNANAQSSKVNSNVTGSKEMQTASEQKMMQEKRAEAVKVNATQMNTAGQSSETKVAAPAPELMERVTSPALPIAPSEEKNVKATDNNPKK